MKLAGPILLLYCLTTAWGADLPWPAWRGPQATGVSTTAKPPLEWSESKNIAWKVPTPGLGHSSPVVAEGKVFLMAASPVGEATAPVYDQAPGTHDNVGVTHSHEFTVSALDLKSGKTLWRKALTKVFPHEGGHATGSLASNSPVTDGTHVWAFFGSRGLWCLSCTDGTVVWKKDLGKLTTHHAHGEGASPALFENTLIVPWDQETGSQLFAFDATTGKELWKADRDEITSWSTPLITQARPEAPPQVIVSASKRIRAYDLQTGRVIWQCSGMSRNVIASPVAADGIVYCGCSYDLRAMLAIKLDGASGDITDSEYVLWSTNQRTPYVPSPLLYEGKLYFLGHYQGILSCLEGKSGQRAAGPIRLEDFSDIYASPVAANGRIYLTDRSGDTLVISPDTQLKTLARNHLDDRLSASLALANETIIIRGEKWVYAVREK